MAVEYREEPCKSALNRVTGMPFSWSLNPYMGCAHRCTFCYVRAFELRAERPSDDRYGRTIRVKTNVAEVLRAELARPSWSGDGIAIGAATDPYQPAEGRYRLTRACLEVLADARNPFSLITRGPMILRDMDVLQAAARSADVSVTFSVPTLDEDVWRRTEPGTREHFLEQLAEHWPEQLPRYEELYGRRAYLPQSVAAPVREQVAELRRKHGVADRRSVRLSPPPRPEQLALAV